MIKDILIDFIALLIGVFIVAILTLFIMSIAYLIISLVVAMHTALHSLGYFY